MDNVISLNDKLSPEAKKLLEVMMPIYTEKLKMIEKIPVSILVWGPSPQTHSTISDVRLRLRNKLRENGHLAMLSEEICDNSINISIRAQQILQAEQYDLIISIPETEGSIGEIHDFANDIRFNKKIIIFLNEKYHMGYTVKSLQAISTFISCEVKLYSDNTIDNIIEESIEVVNKIREYKFIMGGRF